MRWTDLGEESCSVARGLSVIGDRWTLLILRDCFLKVRRFEDFQARLGITRHILAGRLKKLVEKGVLAKVPYQSRPLRHEYHLTDRGRGLQPILLLLMDWGQRHFPAPDGPALINMHTTCGHALTPVVSCAACGEVVQPQSVRTVAGPSAPPGMIPTRAAAE